jgi:hypothetical protein
MIVDSTMKRWLKIQPDAGFDDQGPPLGVERGVRSDRVGSGRMAPTATRRIVWVDFRRRIGSATWHPSQHHLC